MRELEMMRSEERREALEVEGLVKRYGATRALDGLTLKVPRGVIFGLLGPNGAGKTTTLKIAMGLTGWEAGSIRVCGLDPKRDRYEVQRRAGYLPESRSLLDWLRVGELISFNRAFYPRWSREREVELVGRFELNLKAKVGRLSLGERTRLCLLLALAQEPEILLLDEPTNGLDPAFRMEFFRILREEYLSSERSVVISTHNLPEVEMVCDQIGIIQRGRMRLVLDMEEARESFHRIVLRDGADVVLPGVLKKEQSGRFTTLWVTAPREALEQALRKMGQSPYEIVPITLFELYTLVVADATTVSAPGGPS
jgi:ABC-2 type transport system ATP-binding protein